MAGWRTSEGCKPEAESKPKVCEQARAVDPSRRANRRFVNKSTTSAEQISDLRVDNASAFGGNTVLSERGGDFGMQKNEV